MQHALEENKVSRVCAKFQFQNLKRTFWKTQVNGKTILTYSLKYSIGGVGTGFVWLRTGFIGIICCKHGNDLLSPQMSSVCCTVKPTFCLCCRSLVNILVIWHVLHLVLKLTERSNRITQVHAQLVCPNVNNYISMFHFCWHFQMSFILEHRNNDCTLRKNLKINVLEEKLMNKYIGWCNYHTLLKNKWMDIN